MNKDPDNLNERLIRLHQELRAVRDMVEVLRTEIIKLTKRVTELETDQL